MMAEGSESTVAPSNSALTAKEDTENSQIDPSNDAEEDSSLQDVVEVEFHPDCPVCLQPTFYPVKLPCGHIFCFLCIKGVALRSRKCAICRQVISTQYLDKPTLVKVSEKTQNPSSKSDLKESSAQEESEYKWYYEGRNGWWQYDDKTSKEVESCFKSGKRSCTLLIAGFLYLIDFENMFQMRRNEPGRRRRIKRDKCDVDSKGIAGIRSRRPQNITNNNSISPDTNESTNSSSQVGNDDQRDHLDGSPVASSSIQGDASSSSPDSVSQDDSVDAVNDSLETTSLE